MTKTSGDGCQRVGVSSTIGTYQRKGFAVGIVWSLALLCSQTKYVPGLVDSFLG